MQLTEIKLQEIKNRYSIAGNSTGLNQAIETAVKVAPADVTVLISGESGVGKEVFSKIIHSLSKRKHAGFIAVNCGAIPEGTIDSELFGHEKGSFTSAHDSRKGYFETVNGGTIFLDEIAEMPLNTQARLLRVLESGEFLKVGSSKVQKTDVRIIAASNKELYEQIKKNKFREDLYYRLNTVNIKIPPLRERGEDILFLFAKFASDASEKYKSPPLELDRKAELLLFEQKWPGNIRQLKNLVEEISILEPKRKITADILKNYLPQNPGDKIALFDTDNKRTRSDNFTEKELLYKFLFEIKKDISELKSDIGGLLKVMNKTGQEINDSIHPLKQKLLNAPHSENDELTRIIPDEKYNTKKDMPVVDDFNDEEYYIEDDEEVYSLQDQEMELIKKALLKHNGKRKTAATELGISERTLYRKIKQYNLDNF